MKFVTVALALVLAIATDASYVPYSNQVVAYSNGAWPAPVATSTVWPAYGGLYGKAVVPAAVTAYGYPGTYGSWPVYGKTWGYSAAPLVSTNVPTKVIDNGLWSYGPFGNGLGYNKYW